MKKVLEKFIKLRDSKNGKIILFFGFYFVFFLFVFLLIQFTGNKNSLIQEYEKGNHSSFKNQGLTIENFFYDYKVTVDGVLHDYYGKKLNEEEKFKYNNRDYYKNENSYFVKENSYVECDSPFVFREFFEVSNIDLIMNQATYVSKTEYEDSSVVYRYLVSSNTLNLLLYQLDTDYDEIPNEVFVHVDSNGVLTSINFQLDSFCEYSSKCQDSLKIEISYELFGEVYDIKK